jgi:hypothetical protein
MSQRTVATRLPTDTQLVLDAVGDVVEEHPQQCIALAVGQLDDPGRVSGFDV